MTTFRMAASFRPALFNRSPNCSISCSPNENLGLKLHPDLIDATFPQLLLKPAKGFFPRGNLPLETRYAALKCLDLVLGLIDLYEFDISLSNRIPMQPGGRQMGEHPFLDEVFDRTADLVSKLFEPLDILGQPVGVLPQVGYVRDRGLECLDHRGVVVGLEDLLPDQTVQVLWRTVGDRVDEGPHAALCFSPIDRRGQTLEQRIQPCDEFSLCVEVTYTVLAIDPTQRKQEILDGDNSRLAANGLQKILSGDLATEDEKTNLLVHPGNHLITNSVRSHFGADDCGEWLGRSLVAFVRLPGDRGVTMRAELPMRRAAVVKAEDITA